jgi:hypothetical protein
MTMLPEAKYRFLSEDVKRRSGLVLGPEKGYLVESRLAPLARAEGLASVEAVIGVPPGGKCPGSACLRWPGRVYVMGP